MILSVHQPNYMPWIGFFDKLDKSDLLVLLDCPDINKRGFTSRNKIKTPLGEQLLTVPIRTDHKKINEVMLDNEQRWREKHFGTLDKNYARSSYWKDYRASIEEIYQQSGDKLVELTIPFIFFLKEALGIATPIVLESELGESFGLGSERIIRICRLLGADTYLSGTGAAAYNDGDLFNTQGVSLVYQKFAHPIYPQLWGEFRSHLSCVDLLFNCGPQSITLIREYNP
jgi:hypothetical protein